LIDRIAHWAKAAEPRIVPLITAPQSSQVKLTQQDAQTPCSSVARRRRRRSLRSPIDPAIHVLF
jgi:hypothetical protein